MAKNVTIVVEDDELDLLETILATTDFYGDGYDDEKQPNEREGADIFDSFMSKLKTAYDAAP